MRGLIVGLLLLIAVPVQAQVSPDPTRGITITTPQCVWTFSPTGGTLCDGTVMAAGNGALYLWTGNVLYVESGNFWYRWTGTAWAGYGGTEPPTGAPTPPPTGPIPVTEISRVAWDADPGVDGWKLCVDDLCVSIGKPSPPAVTLPAMTQGLHVLTLKAFNVVGDSLPSASISVLVSMTVPPAPTNFHPVLVP